MIDFQSVCKSFGSQEILRDVSFRVNPGEHVGVAGPNGAGKSTIFKMLTGEMSPDSGTISLPGQLRIGHLHQQLQGREIDGSLLGYAENAGGELALIEEQIDRLERRLAAAGASPDPDDLRRLGDLQTRFEQLGGYLIRSRAEATLSGLGFAAEQFHRPFSEFSGGWQMRGELARVLTAEPDVLLLDEPTNYLDVGAVEWLRGYLRGFKGIMLLISHDRYLLNSLTSVTLEVANAMVERYPGNYSQYTVARRARREQALAARQNQERKREQIERFVQRFRSQASKASQVQSRLKMLEKMEEIRVPGELSGLARIKMPEVGRAGFEAVKLQRAGVSYDGENWVFRDLDFCLERGVKAAIVGANGRGKTTLLRVLAGTLPLCQGRRELGTKVGLGYQAQDFAEVLDARQTVFAAARADDSAATDRQARAMLGSFGFSGEAAEKVVDVLSGGEKVRLALVRLLLRNPNLILLDEPTTHLDIPARQALEQALLDFGGTLCFVSHDIEFIRRVADTIYAIEPTGLVKYFGGYDYYRQKLAERESGSRGSDSGSQAGNSADGPAAEDNRKSQRRQRAEARRHAQHRERPLRRRAEAAERQVEDLHQEQSGLLRQLASGAEGERLGEINRRLHRIQPEIAAATAAWEEAELALDELRPESSPE